MKKISLTLALLMTVLAGLIISGCTRSREPNIELIQDMFVTPAVKAQDEDPNSMKLPPENTVPQGFEPYNYQSAEEAGAKLKNPLTVNDIVVQEGQKHYMTYCFVCHGAQGDGKGPVAEKWPSPIPGLNTQVVRNFPDGHIYHIVTKGRGMMGSYAAQVKPDMRWKIISYIRHMQSKTPVAPAAGTTAQ